MNTQNCPDRDTLQKLLLGDLPADQRESLGDHVLNCDKCAESAETLSLNDDLTAAIRSRKVYQGDEEVLDEVIERGKQLQSEIETVESQATILTDKSQSSPQQSQPMDGSSSGTLNRERREKSSTRTRSFFP